MKYEIFESQGIKMPQSEIVQLSFGLSLYVGMSSILQSTALPSTNCLQKEKQKSTHIYIVKSSICSTSYKADV